MCHACYLSTWPGHWPFYYRRHFQIVPKKTGGCRQHGNSWSEWFFSLKKTEDNIWRVNASFQDYVAKIYDPVSVSAKSRSEQVGNYIFFFLLLTPCSWADLHLNVFVILKNLLNGFVQKNPFGFSSRGVAECQAPSAKYNICAVSSASSVAGYYCFSMAGCFYLLKQNNQE